MLAIIHRSFDRFLLVYIILDEERYGYKKTFPGALQVFSIWII